jgi:hypothetical protein
VFSGGKPNMKKLGIISLLLCASSAFSIPSSVAFDDQELHTCNDLLQAMLDHKEAIVMSIKTLMEELSSQYDIQQKDTLTRLEKQAILQTALEEYSKNVSDYNEDQVNTSLPCELTLKKIQEITSEFLPQLLEKIAEQYPKNELAHFRTLTQSISTYMNDNLEWNLTLVCINFSDVSEKESISYSVLTDLIVQHIIRGLVCIHQELMLYAKRPLLNALYAQGMIQTLVSATIHLAFQRWLEHDFSEQQWQQLLDAQYNAFAGAVPAACAIIALVNGIHPAELPHQS